MRYLATVGLILLSVIFMVGCDQAPATSPTALSIAAPVSPASGPLYVANEKGFLTKEGLNTTIVPFTSGRLALDALLAGKAEVALVAETPLALAAFQEHRVVIVATITESSHKLAVLNKPGVDPSQGLKGKKVATLMGSAGEFWMYSYLKANGLSTSDVNVVNLQPTDAVAALVRGDIDAFFLWEPYPYLAKKELGDKVTLSSSEGTYLQIFNVVVTRDFAQKSPDTVNRLLRALQNAVDFMHAAREESVKIVAENSNMEVAAVDGIWDDHNFTLVLDKSLLDYLERQGAWAIATGRASGNAPDYRKLVDIEPLRRLHPESVTVD